MQFYLIIYLKAKKKFSSIAPSTGEDLHVKQTTV